MAGLSETRGDHHNIACPHCGKNNHSVSRGTHVVCGEITRFSRECFHCHQTIFYHARHEIMVTAYSANYPEVLREICPNCGCGGYDGSTCQQYGIGPRIGP